MKKLFKNYEFEFDKNQKKIISSFINQALKQMDGNDQFLRDINVFNSIKNKLNSSSDKVKLTKEEKTKLSYQLNENIKYLEKKMNTSWFLTKWFYKNMYTQYKNLITIFAE